MLKRLYILAFVVTLLWALRVYWKVTGDRVPASPPSAPNTPVPELRRDTASEKPSAPLAARGKETKPQIPSKADTTPEVLLELKRRGTLPARGTEDPTASPLARYATLKRTPGRRVGSRKFIILGARAVAPEDYYSGMGPVLFEDGDTRIVADSRRGWDDLVTSVDSRPLVVNPSNGRLALVTGALHAKVDAEATAQRIATSENLTLIHYDSNIRVAFFRAPVAYALLPALVRIGAAPGVSQVELEIIESRKVGR